MKNSMLGFLFPKDGKNRQERKRGKKESHSWKDDKEHVLPDAKFSSDASGKKLEELWGKCKAFCSSSLRARCSNKFNEEDQINFERFVLCLVTTCEEVISNSQRNNPLVENGYDLPPNSVHDIWGMPTELVVSISNFFLSYVCVGSDELPKAVTFPNDISETLLVFDSLEFSLSRVLDSFGELEDRSNWIMTSRYNFLLISNAMSTICAWPHNRNIITRHFGLGFSRLMVQMIRSLASKLDDAIIAFNDREDQNTRKELEEDSHFLLHSLLALIRALARSVPGLGSIAQKCATNVVPVQPWLVEDFSSFGFCTIAELCTLTSEYSKSNTTTHKKSVNDEDFSFFGSGRAASTCGYEDTNSLPSIIMNEWSMSMIQSGVVQVLVSLLSKLTYLSRSLAATTRYVACEESSDIEIVRTVHWSHCAALQCEVLFLLFSYVEFQPRKVRSKFNMCSGAGIINSLLSMQDSPPHEKISMPDFNLGFHRGLLCLNFIKETIRVSAGINEVDRDVSLKDSLLSLESLPLFMAWIQAYVISHGLLELGRNPRLLRNIVLETNTSVNIPIRIPTSELWPWSGDSRESCVGCEDVECGAAISGGIVNVDVLSHGSVMLRYAESSTLMEKYIKSMQYQQSYSLRSAVMDVFEGPNGDHSAESTPWFVSGTVSSIWDNFFCCLIGLCQASHAGATQPTLPYDQDSKGNIYAVGKDKSSGDYQARSYCCRSILASVLSSLRICAEAQSPSEDSNHGSPPLPTYQFYMVHFLGVMIHCYPDDALQVFRNQKMWGILASSKSFLLGGVNVVRRLFQSSGTAKKAKNFSSETMSWSLHEASDLPCQTNTPPSHDIDSSNVDLEALSKEETIFEGEDSNSSIESDEEDSVGSEKLGNSFSDGSSGVYGTPEMPFFSRFDSGDVNSMSVLAEGSDVIGKDNVSGAGIDQEEFGPESRINAFAWLTLFDFIFQLMSSAVLSVENTAQKISEDNPKMHQQGQNKGSLPGSTTEVYSLLQSIGRDTPDHVVLQTMNWIKRHLVREMMLFDGSRPGAVTSEKYKHILFKCLSLCKFQLLSTCDSSTEKSQLKGDDNCPPFWIGNEIPGVHKSRPFLWSARASVISLIVTIMRISPGTIWSKAFLPKNDTLPAPANSDRITRMTVNSPGYNQGETNLTPKHVTLLLLLLDPRCRDVSMYILTELLHACTCLNYNMPVNDKDGALLGSSSKGGPKQDNSPNPLDADVSKTIYAAIFHDILKCLFVYHIKYSMLQPAWCDGCAIVSSICHWIRCFLGNPDRAAYLPYYQSMFLSYGHLGPHHHLLNWIKPRPHIFRELFLSVDQCIKKCEVRRCWNVDTTINLLRHFLSMLTALMKDSGSMKHKFSMLMLLKKYSKNKAKVVSQVGNSMATGAHQPSSCNFHDVAGMVTALEPSPSLETILILFDMLLDGPKQNNRSLVDSGKIMTEGMFCDEDSDVCMCNMVIIPIILLLVPSCSLPLQKCILRTLQNFVSGRFSLVNLSKCCDMQPPVLDSLLDLFLLLKGEVRPLCLDLMQVIGIHNISVAQLKRLFRLMHIQSDHRPAYSSMLLRCLRGMVSTERVPKHSFLFEGSENSGLKIPDIDRWPAPASYSFCFWFCVRSPSKVFVGSDQSYASRLDGDGALYRPTLLSFKQRNGIGVEVYLREKFSPQHTYALVLETVKDASDSTLPSSVVIEEGMEVINGANRKVPIREGHWYFLMFSHAVATFRSKSEVSVFLSGNFSKHYLSYPRFSGAIPNALVGNTSEASGSITSLTGQMGSIYMFADYFTENQMRKLYAIGMDISKGLDNRTSATVESMASHILLAYNPGIWNGSYFLNMAPEKNSKVWGSSSNSVNLSTNANSATPPTRRNSKNLPIDVDLGGGSCSRMHACMLPGAYPCTFCDMRDALDCLGGGRVLIPLFAQFDLPILELDGKVNYEVDPQLALEVIKLLFLLRRDSGQGMSFLKYAGFQLISFFLERISPRHLTIDLLNVFIANAEMLYSDREWYNGVVKYILLNFKLWMFAPYDVQYHLFTHILGLCETETSVMRELLTIRELFDALYVIYSKTTVKTHSADNEETEQDNNTIDETEEHVESANCSVQVPSKVPTTPKSVLVTQLFFHEVTGDVVGQKLGGKELDDIRRLIFCIIYALITGEKHGGEKGGASNRRGPRGREHNKNVYQSSGEEIQCIMYYISHEKEDVCKLQALKLLLDLLDLDSISVQKQILLAMSTGVKVYPLLSLCVSSNPKIRMYSFLSLCNIIQLITVHGKLPVTTIEKKKHTATGRSKLDRSNSEFTEIDSNNSKDQYEEDEAKQKQNSPGASVSSEHTTPACKSTLSRSSTVNSSSSLASPPSPSPLLKTPRQNSFSFIPPSLSATLRKKAEVFEGSKDSFSDIGIPVDTLRYVILWAQSNLLAEEMDSETVDAQCEAIVSIMTRTLTGKRSTYLLPEIDAIFNYGESETPRAKNQKETFSTKHRTTSGKMSNENLFETVFCVPAFVPVLLNFISRDVVSYSLRFSTLVMLKTKLQSFENCDLFLQIPQWQTSMFELLINEQKRISALQCRTTQDDSVLDSPCAGSKGSIFTSLRDNEKELDRSTGILQTGLRMLCDLFLYGVEYGCPSSENIICRPADETSYTAPKPTPISMIQAIGRGERKLGVKILKETMSYLRCYAERGDLDVDLIGLSLLQQIVNSLNLRNDSWNSDTSELSHHRHIKIRVFNSACWLTTFFIVEFLTLPVVQNFSRFGLAFDSKRNTIPGESSGRSSGHDVDLIKIKHKLFNDSFVRDASQSNFSNKEDLMIDAGVFDEPTKEARDIPFVSTSRPRSCSYGTIPSFSRARSSSPLLPTPSEGNSDSFWGLFGSLLSLLESLDPNIAKKGAVGIKIAFVAGLKNSQTIVDQMNETMEEAIGCQVDEDDAAVEKTITGSVLPVHKLASQISWRIVRVVCNIYCECGSSRQLLSQSIQESQLQAIKNLTRTISNLEQLDRKSFEFETLHTIAKVTEVLRHTLHKPHDNWIIASFRFLRLAIKKIRPHLLRKLSTRSASGSITSDEEVRIESEAFEATRDSSNRRGSSSPLGDDSETGQNMPPSMFEDDRRPPQTHAFGSNSMSDYTLGQINAALGFKNWDDASTSEIELIDGVTWRAWEDKMKSVFAKGVEMEDVVLAGSLTDLGMHKQTEQIEHLLATAQSSEAAYFTTLSSRSEAFVKKATEHEMNSLQRLLKSSEALNKKNAVRWNTILEELANERGPWGVGADETMETYWAFDLREDSLRRRFKLCRNAKGSNHPMATFFLNPPIRCAREDCERNVDNAQEGSGGVLMIPDAESQSTQYSKTMTPGLWKDLLKYQTSAVENAEEDVDPAEEDHDAEISLGDEFGLNDSDGKVAASTDSLSPSHSNFVIDAFMQDKVLFTGECEIITPSTNSLNPPAFGTLEISSSKLTFTKKGPEAPKASTLMIDNVAYENHDHLWACESFPTSQWNTDEIVNILRRNFHLRNTAVEIFLSSRKSVFINLHDKNAAFRFFFVVRNVVKPPYLAPFLGMRPQKMVAKMTAPGSSTNITLAWQSREISNFEYLMHLNTIAGRSFNDLSQYPVFPWILADYTSNVLRLREPSTYRDLSWPMGAQNEDQRELIRAKYEDVNAMYLQSMNSDVDMGPSMPPFHYGSHYSTAGFVLWYLMRSEPFTSLHVQLQDGKFDRPDRLFDSVEAAWKGCINNPSDVKELVPEFFYCPEIFENINNLNLGVKSSSQRKIGDIVLPPWASDPLEFVRLNRKALESEYVSRNLHHWIDLIFGHKQRPPHLSTGGNAAAVESCNVFFHLTYAGAVDLDELLENDKSLFKQYVNQIAEFGQTPAQLFTDPHPQRQSIDNADIAWPIASVVLGADTIMKGDVLPDKPKKIICFKSYKVSAWPVLLIALTTDKLVTVDSSRVLGSHSWQSLPPDVVPPYRFKADAVAYEVSQGLASVTGSISSIMTSYASANSIKEKRIGVPFLNQAFISQPSLTSQDANDDSLKFEPMPRKEFIKTEKEAKRASVALSSQSKNRSRFDSFNSLNTVDSSSTDELSDMASAPSNSTSKRSYPSPKRSSPRASRKRVSQSSASTATAGMPRVYQKRRTQTRAIDNHLSSQLFAVHPSSKLLFSCGYWDHSFKVTMTETGRLLQSINQHKDAVTCLTLASSYGQTWLVTGSRDCTLMVWDVKSRDLEHPIGNAPVHILYGHDDAVTSVSVSADLDVVVSGSDDGTLILHCLRDGSYIRSIVVGSGPGSRLGGLPSAQHEEPAEERGAGSSRRQINWVCVTPEAYVVVYLADEHMLFTYTINGRFVASKDIRERLYAFALSEDGKVILTGGENCLVVFRWVHTLELANDGPRKGLEAVLDGMVEESEGGQQAMSSPIRSIYMSKQERHLIVGTDKGDIRVFAQDSDYLRQRLQRKLEEIGIL